MLFFLKFKSQLRRTRPDIIRQIDEFLTNAILGAGGKITSTRTILSAVFKEDSIGIWLDIFILIENLKKIIDESEEFFGYSLVLSVEPPESPEPLARFLASGEGGIFLDSNTQKNFVPYAEFESLSEWQKEDKNCKYGSDEFYKIKGLKKFVPQPKDDLGLKKNICSIIENGKGKNILLLGPSFLQTRTGLYEYLEKTNGSFPSLSICFGSIGLGALVDAWSSSIRSICEGQKTEEVDSLWELLFCDRIRDEVSDFIVRSVKRFLTLVLEHYITAARKKKRTPVIVLENINMAGKKIADLLLDSLTSVSDKNSRKILILGTGDDDIQPDKLSQWETAFDVVSKIDGEDYPSDSIPELPCELWEIVYAVTLFCRYFPPELLQRLFDEEEKNPLMVKKAFSIFHASGIIDNPDQPWPLNRRFEDYSRKLLNDKAERVKSMVRGRLLDWAAKRNINPCFRLLTIIAGLNGVKQIDDLLLLKSISSDILNETISGIETAQKSGQLEELVTFKRADAIRYVYKTSRALYTGNERDIDYVFSLPPVDCEEFPVLKAQVIVNLCGYYLGRHDKMAATIKAKEAIMVGQNENTFCLPQAYRLFALVCLSKQDAAESIEYLSFALANAEKTGNYHEMGITSYYAAAAQFLYGDIFNAKRLAKKSIGQSVSAGRPDWSDRARFLEGRLEFELGNYSEAHSIFEALRQKPFGNMTPQKEGLLLAWIYRAKIYYLYPNVPKPENAGYDADLFELEAAYLAGDYKKAMELSNSLTNPFSRDNFLYTEQPNWSSGFAQCEHLYFSLGEIQDRMICLFQSLAMSKLSEQGSEEAAHNLQKIFREERLCEMDPWDAFYYYAKYRILEQMGANLVDMSTAVSIAFKRLQRRASRIENVETRRQYLNGSRWNHELCLAAKDFKLI